MIAALVVVTLAAGAVAVGGECASCVSIPDGQLDVYKEGLPLSVWTDSEFYDHSSVVTVNGYLRPENSGHPVIMTVTGPSGNVVDVAQVEPSLDGSFSVVFDASGPLWKSDGAYVVEARSGPDSRVFRTQVVLVPHELGDLAECGPSQAPVHADNGGTYCIEYRSTGEITGVEGTLSIPDRLLSMDVRGPGAGTLWLEIPRSLLDSRGSDGQDVPFGVFSGGVPVSYFEQDAADDVRTLRVPYGPDLEWTVEVTGTSAVPEFGAVLAVAATGAAVAAGAARFSKQ